MKVKDLVEKLGEYLPDVEVAYEEVIDRIAIYEQDFEFRMERFKDSSSDFKPYYKVIISAKKENGKTNWDNFKDVNPEEDL